MGFADGKIQSLKDNQFKIFDCNFFKRATNRILEIVSDSAGNILMATDEGIFLIKKKLNKYSVPNPIRLQDNQDFRQALLCQKYKYNSRQPLIL